MKPNNFSISELIESLNGTCKTIAEALPDDMEEDDLTEADHEDIDNQIFLCEQCNWWCEICERIEEDDICEDCKDED